MRGARWIAGGLALGIGALSALGMSGSAGARGSAACVLLCGPSTTTATQPTATVAPVFGTPALSNVTYTSATANAPVTPGSAAVTYALRATGNGATDNDDSGEVPAGFSAVTVTNTFTGLTPNSTYQVTWGGSPVSSGTPDSYAPPVSFTTPILPAVALGVTSRNELATLNYEHDATFAGTVSGVSRASTVVTLQVSVPPYRSFRQYRPADNFSTNQQVTNGRFSFTPDLDRNARLRVYVPGDSGTGTHHIREPSVSKFTQIYVEPSGSGSTTRPNPYSAASVETASFLVHPVPASWRGEDVYFYAAHTPKGPYRLIGRAPLRPKGFAILGIETVSASFHFNDSRAVYGGQCIRHRILSDMGLAFTDAKCGAQTLN